jgi:hypothetical protein
LVAAALPGDHLVKGGKDGSDCKEGMRMEGDKKMSRGKVGVGVIAFTLWVTTAVIGFLEINVIIEMVLRVYASLWGDYGIYGSEYWNAVVLRWVVVFLLGLSWIVIFIGGGEYHAKRLGQPKSWKLFGWTIAVELSILALALYI